MPRFIVRREYLQRNEAFQVRITGLVNYAHAAFAQLLRDLVMPERLADHENPSSNRTALARISHQSLMRPWRTQ